MKPINVIFTPYYKSDRTSNPYQNILEEHLSKLGANIEASDSKLSELIIKKRWRKNNILHLHWIHSFYISRNRLCSSIDLIFFLFELLFLKAAGMKIVWTAHNIESHENKYPALDKVCRKFISMIADNIFVHSKIGKTILAKKISIKDTDKIVVAPHGNYIDYYKNEINKEDARKILGINKKCFVNLFFGRIRDYKGIIELIENFKKLGEQKNIALIIAGKSENKMLTETIKKEASKNRKIKFIEEFIPKDKIQLYMNSADIVVLPYKKILTSGSAILAMSFKKPLIAQNIGDLQDILNKKCAIFYKSHEKDGMLKAMKKAFKNKNQLNKMGEFSYQNAKKLDWNKTAKKIFLVYRKLLNDSRY